MDPSRNAFRRSLKVWGFRISLLALLPYLYLLPWQVPPPSTDVSRLAGFYHVTTLGRWRAIFNEQVQQLLSTGLLAKTDALTLTVLGNDTEMEEEAVAVLQNNHADKFHSKIRLAWKNTEENNEWEFPALSAMHSFCQKNPDYLIYYMHTKGVIPNTESHLHMQDDWRRYMSYFVMERHLDCIAHLRGGADTCGVDYKTWPFWHYTGNFWWARCDYIKQLMAPEVWRYAPSTVFPHPNRIEVINGSRFRSEAWLSQSSPRPANIVSCLTFWKYDPAPPEEYHHWTCHGPRVTRWSGGRQVMRPMKWLVGPAPLVFVCLAALVYAIGRSRLVTVARTCIVKCPRILRCPCFRWCPWISKCPCPCLWCRNWDSRNRDSPKRMEVP